ncbi:MAG TPA: M20/M25/M40 family metallo-hydrolase, partial [Isosphaeraceae bacterium]
MHRHPLWLGLVALGIAGGVSARAAEKTQIDRIVSEGREDSRVMEHLDYLTNRFGPRLTGSDNLRNTEEWARDRFRSFGIDNARLERWGEFPVGYTRGPSSGRMVEPEARALSFGTNAWTAGTKGVVRGRAVLAPANEEQLAGARERLRGAWVFVPSAGRRPSAADAEFRKTLDAAYAEAGIAGLVRPTRGELILTGGDYRVSWEKLPQTPAINLLQAQFDEIADRLRRGQEVVLEFDIRNYFRPGPVPLRNVVADIPGTEFPDEYVIVGGHLDSWDGATGTTDNGTGCATTLEAARILMHAGVWPRRSIRFMLWSGEEQGLLGSRAYIKAHPELMEMISAVLVHDGGTNYLSGLGVTQAMRQDMDEALAPLLGLDAAMPFALRDVPGLRPGGSDHDSFLRAGVPGFFWGQSGRADYRRTHHTQFDTYDAAVPAYQRHSALVVALAAFGIAELDHRLPRQGLVAPSNRRVVGVQLDDLTIVEVLPESVAAAAGLRPGDVIVRV